MVSRSRNRLGEFRARFSGSTSWTSNGRRGFQRRYARRPPFRHWPAAAPHRTIPRVLPAKSEDVQVPTAGACMRPWIWPGGTLGVQYCDKRDLRIGDIAVWFDGETLRSHRVIATGEVQFTTRSDLATQEDAPTGNEQLLGRAVSFEIFGLAYRLDRGLPEIAGRLIVRAPWLGTTFARAYGPPRRWLGRVADRAYTASPVRTLRRKIASVGWDLRVERSPRELRVSALKRGKTIGRARLRAESIWEFWVARRMRGLGLGRALMDRAILEAKRSGAGAIRYDGEADRRLACLLRTSGFRRDGDRWMLDFASSPDA